MTLWETFSLGSDPYPVWSNAKVFQEVKKGFRLPRPEYNSFPEEKPMDTIYNVSMYIVQRIVNTNYGNTLYPTYPSSQWDSQQTSSFYKFEDICLLLPDHAVVLA